MAVVRITIAHPRPQVRNEVRGYLQELVEAAARMPGFITAYLIESSGASGEVGRVTVWESREAANHAANDPHVMAIHSRLMPDNPEQLQDWDLDATLIVGGHAEGTRV